MEIWSGCPSQLCLWKSGKDPEVMSEDGPADGELAVGKSLAEDGLAEEMVEENTDAAFSLGAAALQSGELPGTHPAFQLAGVSGAEAVVNLALGQVPLVAGAVEAAVGADRLELDLECPFDLIDSVEDEASVLRRGFLEELPVDDQALRAFAQQQGVTELDWGRDFIAEDDADGRLIEAEDFLVIGDGLFAEDALEGLFSGGGQKGEDVFDSAQHDVGLGAAPFGFFPLGIEEVAITLGVIADRPDQPVHLAQDFFTVPFAVAALGSVGHLDAKSVHPGEKTPRLLHSMTESLAADQFDRFDQCAGGVSKEDPIDRIVDLRLETGGIEETGLQIHRRFESQPLGVFVGLTEQLLNNPIEGLLVDPMGIALEGAFSRHDHAVDLAQAAEVLQQRAVGQASGKGPEPFLEQMAGDIAAEGPTRVKLMVQLGFDRDDPAALLPLLDRLGDETLFDSRKAQQLVDALELLPSLPVIEVANHDGQGQPDGSGKRNQTSWHKLAYRLAYD